MNALSLFRRSPPDAATCIAEFLSAPEHHWIAGDKALLERVAGFLCRLPASDLAVILRERRLLLLFCNPKMSCAFHQFQGREIVLIFPDLYKLLLSSEYLQDYAILAHELGHIFHGHSRHAVDPLRAQIEADRYAAHLGFGKELFAVLRLENPSAEIRERLKFLKSV